ncbi:AMP-binding protein [Micromonospora sp. DT48]|uniref:AMP-binding protein n=1 Tax=Micromonospora sp. DT48 TaxID=3393429 RepID=UPI003CE9960F
MDIDLLAWTRRPRPGGWVRFATAEGWDEWPYDALAALTRRSAGALVAAGVRPGDVVALGLAGGPRFVAMFFGALLAGATPAPLPPPAAFASADRYDAHVDRMLGWSTPILVVHDEAAVRAGELAAVRGVDAAPVDALLGAAPDADREPGRPLPDVAVVQFTSGTTGPARGVRVATGSLTANLGAIARWLGMTPADPTASWLPVHHDMGLVGCLLLPVTVGGDLWSMPTVEFLRHPLRYLECFGRHGARLTAMPAFGLDYVTRRVGPESLVGLDFGAWRSVIVGAERIPPATLRRFAELLGPFGLRPTALRPAYGLAEATLAVTGVPSGAPWRAVTSPSDGEVVGCGTPLAGVTVSVRDAAGQPVAPGRVGEIVVGGTGVGSNPVHTGDAGFLLDGELFLVGRLGDGVKVHGRFVFAADVETAIAADGDIPLGRVAVLAGSRGGRPTVVVVLERPQPGWWQRSAAALTGRFVGADLVGVTATAGGIARTTSGKPRRRAMWEAFLDDRLGPVQPLTPSPSSSAETTASSSSTR